MFPTIPDYVSRRQLLLSALIGFAVGTIIFFLEHL